MFASVHSNRHGDTVTPAGPVTVGPSHLCHASCHVMLVTVRVWVPGPSAGCRQRQGIVSLLALLFTGSPLDRISKTGSL